jgi:hypothetical protein
MVSLFRYSTGSRATGLLFLLVVFRLVCWTEEFLAGGGFFRLRRFGCVILVGFALREREWGRLSLFIAVGICFVGTTGSSPPPPGQASAGHRCVQGGDTSRSMESKQFLPDRRFGRELEEPKPYFDGHCSHPSLLLLLAH